MEINPVSEGRYFSKELHEGADKKAGNDDHQRFNIPPETKTEPKNFDLIRKRINEKFYNSFEVIYKVAELLLKEIKRK